MATAIPFPPAELERAIKKLTNEEPLTPAEGRIVRARVDALVRPRPTDVGQARARGVDVERLRAMGVDEARIAVMCDESMTPEERLRSLGIEDEGPYVTLRTPEELDAYFGAEAACAPSA
jgi:hypothetical protein